MSKELIHPVTKMVLPKDLQKIENGKLTKEMLVKLDFGGVLYKDAAVAFNALYKAAKAAGYELMNIGDFRPYERQLEMFKDRYSEKDLGRNPQITRTWNGKTFYLKPGKSPSGVPGTSNHGLGLAIDVGLRVNGKLATLSSSPRAYRWMCENAPSYGFYLQGAPTRPDGKPNPEYEAWHWQYCVGDKVPPALKGSSISNIPTVADQTPDSARAAAKEERIAQRQANRAAKLNIKTQKIENKKK
jgi:D-alanyl-D-alanine dipeptidase